MNELVFTKVNPKEMGEEWAVDFDISYDCVGIEIDGKELVDILFEVEKNSGADDPGFYGHITAKNLYYNLMTAAKDNTDEHEFGADLLCCRDCGDELCRSATAFIDAYADKIIWKVRGRGCPDTVLEYCFEREKYDEQTAKLKNWADGKRKDDDEACFGDIYEEAFGYLNNFRYSDDTEKRLPEHLKNNETFGETKGRGNLPLFLWYRGFSEEQIEDSGISKIDFEHGNCFVIPDYCEENYICGLYFENENDEHDNFLL